jgi:Rrf2 family protein
VLSKGALYGLKAVLALGRAEGRAPVRIADLAQAEAIPRKFLERILLRLQRRGVLRSKVGVGGGYALARPADLITIGEIVRLLDGPLAPVPCVSQTAYRRCTECADERTCGIRLVMKDARDAIAAVLDRTTVREALDRSEAARRAATGRAPGRRQQRRSR